MKGIVWSFCTCRKKIPRMNQHTSPKYIHKHFVKNLPFFHMIFFLITKIQGCLRKLPQLKKLNVVTPIKIIFYRDSFTIIAWLHDWRDSLRMFWNLRNKDTLEGFHCWPWQGGNTFFYIWTY
jgi:hypothetical protein